MLGGFAGKFLWVDLSAGEINDEVPGDDLLRDFIGGYGVAARVLYDRQRPGVDPLGPENILGFLTGPLTASPAPSGVRWTVAARSPLTGTWGDSNCSGYFGPAMKHAGYDAVFFTGIAERPVYLHAKDGSAELRDATDLWGMDTYEVEDWVKSELGKRAEAACIGPAGEKMSRIGCIIHHKGRAAGRSGLGAVMGSKRLKAVVAEGDRPVPLADAERAEALRKKYVEQINGGVGLADFYRKTGTPGFIEAGIEFGDSPTRNWGGVGPRDFGDRVDKIGFDAIDAMGKKRRACWRCPIACWGEVSTEFGGREVHAHVPEYETAAAFGSDLLNDDLPSIVAANELCNRMGLDTISSGATIAFAIECRENGLLADDEGLDLTWGSAGAIVSLLEKMALRQPGLGELLADGVKIAAERIGQGAEKYAIHVGGQELAMHDPRFEPALGLIYQMDATPGRHTQGSQWFWPEGFDADTVKFGEERDRQDRRGRALRRIGGMAHVMNASGICLFGYLSTRVELLPEFLAAVTGHPYTLDDLILAGERIANMRQAFNVREGYNPIAAAVAPRAYGSPPLEAGPTAGVRVEIGSMRRDYLDEMGWTQDRAVPTREKLISLGLDDVARDLWPQANEH